MSKSELSYEDRFNRYESTIHCIICRANDERTMLVYDRQEKKLIRDIHRVDVDDGGHCIFFCTKHYQEIKKGIK